jgi:hypothetical protein
MCVPSGRTWPGGIYVCRGLFKPLMWGARETLLTHKILLLSSNACCFLLALWLSARDLARSDSTSDVERWSDVHRTPLLVGVCCGVEILNLRKTPKFPLRKDQVAASRELGLYGMATNVNILSGPVAIRGLQRRGQFITTAICLYESNEQR